MAIYSYKAINNEGREIKATLNAENVSQAKQKLHGMGYMLLSIEEKTSAKETPLTMAVSGNVRIDDLALMTRQLATLIKAKIPIAEALLALVDQVDHPTLRIVLAEIRQKINEGSSFAKALSDYPKIFNNVYVNMVDAGEASGTLEIVLLRLADFSEKQYRLKNKIISSMTYPMVMAFVGTAMMVFIFVLIIPKIAKIFTSMNKELPTATKFCIAISNFLQNYWWTLIIGIPMAVVLFNRYIKTKTGESKWHAFLLKLPLIGPLVKMINIARFCSTLSTLLTAGVPILIALRIVKNLISNVHIQAAVEQAKDAVSEGASMTGPLINSGHFPPLVTHMIRLGEKSGEVENMLTIVAENYDNQVNTKLDALTSILEPIMMILLGGAVAFIVISVIVPMINLTTLKH